VGRIDQPVLPLTPAQATPIGSIAALAEGSDGGVVFVSGLVTFTFAAGDRFGRKVAAAQLASTEIATVRQVAAAFGVHPDTLSRWKTTLPTQGVGGLMLGMPGPKGPRKLTDELVGGIRELESRGLSQRAIAARAGVDSATVRVALGRRKGSAGWEAGKNVTAADVARAGWQTSGESGQPASAAGASDRAPAWRGGNNGANDDNAGEGGADRGCGAAEADNAGDTGAAGAGGLERLPVLPAPISRDTERVMARWGLLEQAVPVFTPGAHLPLAGLLLILPALAVTGLLEGFDRTYGGLKNGFYGLRVVVLTMVFLAMLRDPRAEGLTRVNPADLGRMLGLDRAPEVKTLRRKLERTRLPRQGRGAATRAGRRARESPAGGAGVSAGRRASARLLRHPRPAENPRRPAAYGGQGDRGDVDRRHRRGSGHGPHRAPLDQPGRRAGAGCCPSCAPSSASGE
jgi:transposase